LLLINDVRVAATSGGRAYHGNAAEHREQSEVEGTHDSVAECCIVRRFVARAGERGTHKRLAWIRYSKVEKGRLGRCEDWDRLMGPVVVDSTVLIYILKALNLLIKEN
jgi:hypothetical protein